MFWQQIHPGYKLGFCDYCGETWTFNEWLPGMWTNICKSDEDLIKRGNIITQIIIKPSEQLQPKDSNVEELFEVVVIASVEGKLNHQWYLNLCVLDHVTSDESTLTNVTQLCCIFNVIIWYCWKGRHSCQDAIRWNKKHCQCFVHAWAEEEFVEHGQNNKSKLHCGVWFKTMPCDSQARPLIENF